MNRRRAVIAALSCTFAILVAVTVYGVFRNTQQETAESALPPVAAIQNIASSAPPAPPPTSPPAAAKPIVTVPLTSSSMPGIAVIQPMAPSAPNYFTITSIPGITVNAKVNGVEYNDELAAPSCSGSAGPGCPQKAFWIQDRLGVAPGSAESSDPSKNDSTYIVGHAWTQGRRVFDELSDYAMTHYDPTIVPMASTDRDGNPLPDVEIRLVPSQVGSPITMTTGTGTGTGTLSYVISKVFTVLKTDVGRTDEYRLGTAHQLKINTCGIDLARQVDTDYAVIINADLMAAR